MSLRRDLLPALLFYGIAVLDTTIWLAKNWFCPDSFTLDNCSKSLERMESGYFSLHLRLQLQGGLSSLARTITPSGRVYSKPLSFRLLFVARISALLMIGSKHSLTLSSTTWILMLILRVFPVCSGSVAVSPLWFAWNILLEFLYALLYIKRKPTHLQR